MTRKSTITDDHQLGIVLPETLSDLVRQYVARANEPTSAYKRKTRDGYRQQHPDITVMDSLVKWITEGLESDAGRNIGAGARGQYTYAPIASDPRGPLSLADQTAAQAAREVETAEAAALYLERNLAELRTRERDLADEVLNRITGAYERALSLVEKVNDRHAELDDRPKSDSKRRERLRSKLSKPTIAEGIRKSAERNR